MIGFWIYFESCFFKICQELDYFYGLYDFEGLQKSFLYLFLVVGEVFQLFDNCFDVEQNIQNMGIKREVREGYKF